MTTETIIIIFTSVSLSLGCFFVLKHINDYYVSNSNREEKKKENRVAETTCKAEQKN